MGLAILRHTLAEQAVETLRRALRDGAWVGHLPGERELSRQLDISRPTLRLALEQLAREGWLENAPGRQRSIIRPKESGDLTRLRTIGLLTPMPLREVPPFALCWMDKLRELLARSGLQLVIHSGRRWYSRRPEKDLASLTEEAPAAAWLLFVASERMQRWFAESKLPALLAGSTHPGIALPSVDFDYRAVCRHAAGQFLRCGHRRIALLMASPGSAGDGESEAGFREAFATDAGLHAAPIIAHHDGTPGSIRHSLQRLLGLRPAPTAFLVARTMPALMTASELVRRELRIPGDVAVISRDSDHFLEYFSPHLAHYTADPDGYARRLAGFIARLARGAPCRAKAVRIMPQFVAGESLESAAWSER